MKPRRSTAPSSPPSPKKPDASVPAIRCAYTRLAPIADLKPNPRNPNQHPPEQLRLYKKAVLHQGIRRAIVVSNQSGLIVTGHGLHQLLQELGCKEAPVDFQDFATPADETAHMLADNRLPELADLSEVDLKLLLDELKAEDVDLELAGFDLAALRDLDLAPPEELKDAEPQMDRAAELQAEWKTKLGQLWQLGEHRLLCGDSTAAKDFGKLMGEEKAVLCHADPPYGMGKEKDGVANDNLYVDKLDAFQMAWWKAVRPFLTDNASAYIWGNAEDIWRFWHRGGLQQSERLTFRNEITWDKGGGGFGVGTEALRCYFPEERCLFFMLGEQGFNNNADNYWEGWETIRAWLAAECEKMRWTGKDVDRICGVGMFGHWFTKSQWVFIPAEHYQKLQKAAQGKAFKREHDALKREHDALKREFYATRAYFDNAHDNMTDVWRFSRVTGEERHGHATPKPVEMICRIVKSSTPDGAIVVEPFLGSGTTLIACENLKRRCFALEISPGYVAVALQRFQDATGQTPVLLD